MERYKIKKILFIFDSRATFAYSANIIKQIKKKKIKIRNLNHRELFRQKIRYKFKNLQKV